MDNFVKKIKNNFLSCNNCNGNLLNVIKTQMVESENAFETGKQIKIEKGYLETDIWYDIKTTYKCLQCENNNIFIIENHKGGIKQSWKLAI